ncbi:hypothetical protein M413DRAFT_440371 [Hebeloma cylindrosporum]|uniref:Secreted protein n=1 Tax=Hebeloma cylindrosporum TaxID=76867 RepID=A0A0C3CDE0_HEBCY|nr:hypothetical protein M413DRAFT_440371 [Hebeloma cylindrosporum h7]
MHTVVCGTLSGTLSTVASFLIVLIAQLEAPEPEMRIHQPQIDPFQRHQSPACHVACLPNVRVSDRVR